MYMRRQKNEVCNKIFASHEEFVFGLYHTLMGFWLEELTSMTSNNQLRLCHLTHVYIIHIDIRKTSILVKLVLTKYLFFKTNNDYDDP